MPLPRQAEVMLNRFRKPARLSAVLHELALTNHQSERRPPEVEGTQLQLGICIVVGQVAVDVPEVPEIAAEADMIGEESHHAAAKIKCEVVPVQFSESRRCVLVR